MRSLFACVVISFVLSGCALFSPGTPSRQYSEESFVVGLLSIPETPDIHLVAYPTDSILTQGLFEGLVVPDPKGGSPLPGMAETWESSSDAKTHTFTLRADAVWSDGTPVIAQQFVDSWLRVLDPTTDYPYAWLPVWFITGARAYNKDEAGPEAVQIKALDERTFQFETVNPAPYITTVLTHHAFSVLPTHVIKEHGYDWIFPGNIVTNGPYRLEEWRQKERMVLTKSDTYWDRDTVKTKQVVLLQVKDPDSMYDRYTSGEIDWATSIPFNRFQQVSAHSDYQRNEAFITYYYILQTEKEPLDDVRVRKALSMAIDRTALVKEVTRSEQLPAYGIVPPIPGYTGITEDPFNLAEAKHLLAEAGYPNGEGFPTIEILYNTSKGHRDIAEYIQQKWEENLGIGSSSLRGQEWKTYLATRREGTFQVARAGWIGDYYDPNAFLELFTTGNSMNNGRYENPDYDKKVSDALKKSDKTERFKLYQEAEKILITEDQVVIPLYYYADHNLIDTTKWQGWYKNTLNVHPLKSIGLR